MAKLKILLIDDSVTMQKVFQMALEGEDISLCQSFSLKEAESLIASHRLDMIIIDSKIPEEDPIAFSKMMKEDRFYSSVPLYLLVGGVDGISDDDFKLSKADGIFEKPFQSEHIIKEIRKVIETSRLMQENEFDNIDLDNELSAGEHMKNESDQKIKMLKLDKEALVGNDKSDPTGTDSEIEVIPIYDDARSSNDDPIKNISKINDTNDKSSAPTVYGYNDKLNQNQSVALDLNRIDIELIRQIVKEEVKKELGKMNKRISNLFKHGFLEDEDDI